MVLFLVIDVMLDGIEIREADSEGSVALLPFEILVCQVTSSTR